MKELWVYAAAVVGVLIVVAIGYALRKGGWD